MKRRCLFLHIGYPDIDREKEILLARVPGLTDELANQLAGIVHSVRKITLKKAPSVSESIDWARTLLALGVSHIDTEIVRDTLHVLLKYQTDIEKVDGDVGSLDGANLAGA